MVKIEIETDVLARLFAQGVLSPCNIACLDEHSKQALRQLCLEMCKPNNCAQCDARVYCEHSVTLDLPIELRKMNMS